MVRPTHNVFPEFLPILTNASVLEIVIFIKGISLHESSHHLLPLLLFLVQSFPLSSSIFFAILFATICPATLFPLFLFVLEQRSVQVEVDAFAPVVMGRLLLQEFVEVFASSQFLVVVVELERVEQRDDEGVGPGFADRKHLGHHEGVADQGHVHVFVEVFFAEVCHEETHVYAYANYPAETLENINDSFHFLN